VLSFKGERSHFLASESARTGPRNRFRSFPSASRGPHQTPLRHSSIKQDVRQDGFCSALIRHSTTSPVFKHHRKVEHRQVPRRTLCPAPSRDIYSLIDHVRSHTSATAAIWRTSQRSTTISAGVRSLEPAARPSRTTPSSKDPQGIQRGLCTPVANAMWSDAIQNRPARSILRRHTAAPTMLPAAATTLHRSASHGQHGNACSATRSALIRSGSLNLLATTGNHPHWPRRSRPACYLPLLLHTVIIRARITKNLCRKSQESGR